MKIALILDVRFTDRIVFLFSRLFISILKVMEKEYTASNKEDRFDHIIMPVLGCFPKSTLVNNRDYYSLNS
jgi:hypothetical protein